MNKVAAPSRPMPADQQRTLALLDAIEGGEPLTQRTLSRRLGMALGLTNAFLRRLLRKGYIKISTVPGRRLLYALTPKGAAEKIRLTYDYIHVSFGFYREVVRRMEEAFRDLERRNFLRVAFVGSRELFEIADLVARRTRVRLVAGPYPDRAVKDGTNGRGEELPRDVHVVLIGAWHPEAGTLAALRRRFSGKSLVVLFPDLPPVAPASRFDETPRRS